MQTITLNQLINLDSTKSSVAHFQYMGWTLSTHRMEIMQGMMSHLNNWHKMTPANGNADIEAAIIALDPALA